MSKTAVQLFVLRDVSRPLPAILRDVAAAGFDGVEFAYRLPDADLSEIADTLDDTGLEIAGAHVNIESLQNNFDATVELYQSIGCTRLCIPALDEQYFESPTQIEAACQLLSELARRLEQEGMSLQYHNHTQEFETIDGRSGWERLVDGTDSSLSFQLDVGLAAAAGVDPVPLLEQIAGRSSTVHFKDIDIASSGSVEFGDGDVDLTGCMQTAADVGIEWVVYEGDFERDDLDTVARKLTEYQQTVS